GCGGEPGLDTASPGEPIYVVARIWVADQNAGIDHSLEVLGRLGVDCVMIGIDRRIEIYLRLRNVEEAPGSALRAHARLRAGEHVIGRREDFGSEVRHGTQSAEGLDQAQHDLCYSTTRAAVSQGPDQSQHRKECGVTNASRYIRQAKPS